MGGGPAWSCIDEGVVLRLLSGALSPTEVAEVETHADGCAECFELIAAAANDGAPSSSKGAVGGGEGAGASPACERVGHYDLMEPLGVGGMGVVRIARCMETGELVAIKRVRGVEPTVVVAIRREIHALSALEHPGIVHIIDQGIDNGLPWYAMELIRGDTLQDRIDRLAPRQELAFRDVLPVLGIVRDLCETLAFLHGEELVHRDLKPRNVLLRSGDVPVLVDFGLSTRRLDPGRESIESWTRAAGTLAFVAPEQMNGDLVDARADLYALGCILYQIVTGAPPALNRPLRVANSTDVRPRARSPMTGVSVPARLENLIRRLLAPNPLDRIGYAQDALEVLEEIGARGRGAGVTPKPKTYVYRPRLVGRAADIAAIDAMAARCARGRGGRVFIDGESGIGKTRLAMEAAARAHEHGLEVITGSCIPLDLRTGGAVPTDPSHLGPFNGLLASIADRARVGGEDVADRLLGNRGGLLSVYAHELASCPGQDKFPAPHQLPADAARSRLLAALEQTLEAAAQDHGLMLILDDWQWADDLSVAFLEALGARFFERNPVLILGTYRTEETKPLLAARLRALCDEHRLLGSLDLAAMRQMVSDMLAYPQPPEAFTALLARESEGNPFFLTEYVRLAVHEGWLTRDARAGWKLAEPVVGSRSTMPLPGKLRTLLEQRVAALSPPALAVSRFAAVLGRSFPEDLLRCAPGVSHDRVPGAIDELFGRRVIEHDRASDFRFVHDKLRESTYTTVPPAEVGPLHRAAARVLEERAITTGMVVGQAAALAHHWGIAGDEQKEREYRRIAGVEALKAGAYHDAAQHLSRCLGIRSLRADLVENLTLERQLAEAYFGCGDITASSARLKAVVAKAGLPLPRGPAAVAGALLADVVGYLKGTFVHLLGMAPSVRDRGVFTEAARAHERLSHVLFFENETVSVAASSLRALSAAARVGKSPELSRAYANLSLATGLMAARPLFWLLQARARAVAAEVRDRAAAAWAQQLDGVYQAGVGFWHQARSALEQAGETWRELGDRRRWEECLTLLGMVCFQSGDAAKAAAMRNELLAISESPGGEQTRGWALIGQAEDRLLSGDHQGALVALEEAARLGPAVRRVEQLWMRGLFARAYLGLGELADAELEMKRALDLIEGTIPAAFYALEGYSGAVAVALALAARQGPRGKLAGRRRFPEERLVRAIRALVRFARVFPIAAPRVALWRGVASALGGDRGRARVLWQLGLRRARELGRVHDIALLRQRVDESSLSAPRL